MQPNTLHWVQTHFQSAGRGRMGRSWEAQTKKSLLLSVAFENSEMKNPSFLPFLSLVSLAESIEVLWPELWKKAFVKWPNDIMFSNSTTSLKKLAGLIVEARKQQEYFVGWGVNVFLSNPHERACSIEEALGVKLDSELLPQLSKLLQKTFDIKLSQFVKNQEDFQRQTIVELREKWMKGFWRQEVLQNNQKFIANNIRDDGSLELEDSLGKVIVLQSAAAFEMEGFKKQT